MTKLRKILLAVVSIGAALVLSGCEKMVVLNPKGPIALAEKQLLIDALLLMFIIVIPVLILTVVIAYRYRASNKKAKYSPNWAHGTLLEAGWWILPIIIIAVLGTMTWRSTHELDPYKPLESKVKPIPIEVVALQWRWLFIYPEQHIATVNYVEFPVNTPVTFLITADAPMNSFQIQGLAGQIYAMAGMQTKLHLLASEEGVYKGRSVSFSGEGFANMIFDTHVVSNDAFNAWVKKVQSSPKTLNFDSYQKLVPATQNSDVMYFSKVPAELFGQILMKYMDPGMKDMMGRKNPMPQLPGVTSKTEMKGMQNRMPAHH